MESEQGNKTFVSLGNEAYIITFIQYNRYNLNLCESVRAMPKCQLIKFEQFAPTQITF